MPSMNNFIITTDINYNVISLNYGLDLKVIQSELPLMKEDERYIIANIFDTNYFFIKRKVIVGDAILFRLYFEKFRLINLAETKKIDLHMSKKSEEILKVTGFFLLLGYQEDKEILQVATKNNLQLPNSSFRYNIKLLMNKLGVMSRS
jgi:hypothetical protein